MPKLKKNTPHREAWFRAMRKKLGVTTNAEVRAFMKQSGAKAKRTGKGGFRHMSKNNPKRLKQLSKEAVEKRWRESKQS